MCVFREARVQPWCHSLSFFFFFPETVSLGPGADQLLIPSTGVASVHHERLLYISFGGQIQVLFLICQVLCELSCSCHPVVVLIFGLAPDPTLTLISDPLASVSIILGSLPSHCQGVLNICKEKVLCLWTSSYLTVLMSRFFSGKAFRIVPVSPCLESSLILFF